MANDAVGVGEALVEERDSRIKPGFKPLQEQRVEFYGGFGLGGAEHEVREPPCAQAIDDFERGFRLLSEAGAAAMSELHRVGAREVIPAMVLADQPRVRRQMLVDPSSDRECRLAASEVTLRGFTAQKEIDPVTGSDEAEAGLSDNDGPEDQTECSRGQSGPGAPAVDGPGDGDSERTDGEQNKTHALALGEAECEEREGETGQQPDAPGSTNQEDCWEKQQKHGPKLMRHTIETVGLECHGSERGREIGQGRGEWPLDRGIEHLIDPCPKNRAKKGEYGVSRKKICT
jgi:hypothetical protein